MKRQIGALLACTLMLSMGTTAFAQEPQTVVGTGENGETSITITDITPREEKKDETETRFQTGGCYPIQVQTLQDGDTQLLVKTFLVPQDTDPQTLLEEGLIRRGISYQVSDILCRELPGETERKEVSKTVTTSAQTDESEELLSLLSPTLEYSEDGFTGTLTLDQNSIRSKADGTQSYAYTLKDTREYTGLDRNDPYYIPKTAEKNGVTLSLADVQWTPMTSAADNSEVPTLFRATATYTGTAWGSKADGYLVSADYTGEATRTAQGSKMVSIVYEEVPSAGLFSVSGSPINWRGVLVLLLGIGAAVGSVYGVIWLIQRGKESMKEREKARRQNDPYSGRPPMDLPDLLDEMDRGLEDDER